MTDPQPPAGDQPQNPPPGAVPPGPPPADAAPPPGASPSPSGTPQQAYAPPAGGPQPGYAPPPGYGAPQPVAAPLTQEQDRNWSMWTHIGGIVGFLPALIIWLVFKDRGPLVNREGKEALNWQITFTILMVGIWIVTGILGAILWLLNLFLWMLPLALWVLNIVWSVLGGMKVSNEGGGYRYPLNFRLIK